MTARSHTRAARARRRRKRKAFLESGGWSTYAAALQAIGRR